MAEPARTTVGAAFATGRNRFDLIRLGCALLVLASHAWVLTGRDEEEPFAPLLGHLADGGSLGVGVFFVLSGFLIAASAERHTWRRYVRGRVARIVPAFFVVILLQAFVLGPWATRLAPGAYLVDPGTWWAVGRALLFSPQSGLPGVFEGNPVPGQVNGSLWTLRVELLCYAGALLLARVGLLRPRWVGVPLAGAWGALAAVLAARAGVLPAGFASLQVGAIVNCGVHFVMGAAAWSMRDRIPLSGWGVLAGVGATAGAAGTLAGPVMFHVVLPYTVLWLGLAGQPRTRLLWGDVSYGTYLAAFPIQQALLVAPWHGMMEGTMAPLRLIVAAAPLALLYGALSRWLVERPALRWRRA